ncbi:hypothetical protein ACFE04_004685 [Oxalis oulophora]
MANLYINLFLSCSLLLCLVSQSLAFRPKALVLPVTKDTKTNQYITTINQRTPQIPVKLTLNLGGQYLWVDCDQSYVSSSYKPVRCRSAQCSLSGSKSCGDCYDGPKPGCNNNTCGLLPDNAITSTGTNGELASDLVSVQSTDGKNPGKFVSDSKFLFTCGSGLLLEGLAKGVKGMAGLGRGKISMPSIFSAKFSFDRKFAICLTSGKGVMFFGDGPYVMLPGMDVSKSLIYTPLYINPVSTASAYFEGDKSTEYFIGVKSIKVNNKAISLNNTLLKINKEGYGGTKISSVDPYTVLETSIYKSLIKAYAKSLSGVPRVKAIKPFGLCFNSTSLGSTRVGPGVPQIDLVLQSSSVVWSIFGANSMVSVKEDVLCLGFVDGGSNPRTSIVIGGHQIEDNLLQFDLATSKLGFSSSLLFRQTNCANFNFTSNA